jgi:7-cyano-7-deazaguanine synthase
VTTKIDESVVAIVSGGMDSVTLAYYLDRTYREVALVSVDYGQRHSKELAFAEDTARRLGAAWHLIDLTSVTKLLTGSALTDPRVEVPDGHYAEDSMRLTVVPNRNAMMLDVAVAIAVASGAVAVATAVHAGDHAVYPDCRPRFIQSFEETARLANEGFISPRFTVLAPFLGITKDAIASLGAELAVPYELTWSCYKGGELHCGLCGTCTERIEAFKLSGVADPTVYETL